MTRGDQNFILTLEAASISISNGCMGAACRSASWIQNVTKQPWRQATLSLTLYLLVQRVDHIVILYIYY